MALQTYIYKMKIKEIVQNPELMKEYGRNGRQYVADKFNRDKIAQGFYEHIIQMESK